MKGSMNGVSRRKKKRIYRFEEMWFRDEAFSDVITKAWEEGGDIHMNLNRTANQLIKWGKNKFGDFAREMRVCSAQMASLMVVQSEETIKDEGHR